MVTIIGVRFKKNGKIYYFDPAGFDIKLNDHVIVETKRGKEFGKVVLGPKEIPDEKIVNPLVPVIRKATEEDFQQVENNEIDERKAFQVCLEKIAEHHLDMKLIDSEYTFDKSKLLFYFTAEGRIDFRELVKDLASVFRTRIELRQIGVRDETKLMGGYGICGRPLCCSTFLSDFSPVSIKMAKDQGLSLNPSKISGVCGRLMCCLRNEEPAYEELNRNLPNIGTHVTTAEGLKGEVRSLSVLKQRVKVLVELENGEKEVREYSADELTGDRKKGNFIARTLPDEEPVDESSLKELKQMEKEDISELEDETDNETSSRQNSRNYRNSKRGGRDYSRGSGRDYNGSRSHERGGSRERERDRDRDHQHSRAYGKPYESKNFHESRQDRDKDKSSRGRGGYSRSHGGYRNDFNNPEGSKHIPPRNKNQFDGNTRRKGPAGIRNNINRSSGSNSGNNSKK